jgi:hypothetical protein
MSKHEEKSSNTPENPPLASMQTYVGAAKIHGTIIQGRESHNLSHMM